MVQLTDEQAIAAAVKHHGAGRLPEAEAIYRRILAAQPNHPDALNLLGVLEQQAGHREVAIDLLSRAVAITPTAPHYRCNLGNALKSVGRLDDSIDAYQKSISLDPNFAEAHYNLAGALTVIGKLPEAVEAYRRAIALRPKLLEAYQNLGVILSKLGDAQAAIDLYRSALAIRPNSPDVHVNLGNAFSHLGREEEAIDAYRTALTLKPDLPEALSNLARSLHERGDFDAAIGLFQQALVLAPKLPDAHNNLGNSLKARGRTTEAVEAYRTALALQPDSADGQSNLGNSMRELDQIDEAIALCRGAIALRPNFPEAYNNLANALRARGDLEEAIAAYEKAVALKPDFVAVDSNRLYSLHYHTGYDARALYIEHRRWNERHAEPLKSHIRPHDNDRDPNRRLRIGYVSPDFGQHPVGRFLLPLMESHDRTQFEIFCYAHVANPDATTAQFRANADRWRNILSMSDQEAADLIRADRIDILVDLAMHAANNRLLIFARKPAPVQVTYLAYCSTTGLDTMDYRLTDPYFDRPEVELSGLDSAAVSDAVYSEQSIRLPRTYWCYRPSPAAPDVNPLPMLESGEINFGCLNNFCKVTPATLAVWCALLRSVSRSRLLLYAPDGSHRQRVRNLLLQNDLDPARLRFVGRSPLPRYFQTYHSIDIGLDPMPYPGGTTTCDALWMGVPVVSLAGSTAISRGGLSILSNVGLGELVASTAQRYIQIAADLAADVNRLGNLRSTLRQRMLRSPLMDEPGFARDIEAAYREMWRYRCGSPNA